MVNVAILSLNCLVCMWKRPVICLTPVINNTQNNTLITSALKIFDALETSFENTNRLKTCKRIISKVLPGFTGDSTLSNKKNIYLTPHVCNDRISNGLQLALNKIFLNKRVIGFVAY